MRSGKLEGSSNSVNWRPLFANVLFVAGGAAVLLGMVFVFEQVERISLAVNGREFPIAGKITLTSLNLIVSVYVLKVVLQLWSRKHTIARSSYIDPASISHDPDAERKH